MTLRRAALAAAVLGTALATPGVAAPKRACHLLAHRGPQPAVRPATDHGLTIKSADIASNAKELTVVIRVNDVHDPAEPVAGRGYSFQFSRSVEESYVLYGNVWRTSPNRRWVLAAMDSHYSWEPDDKKVLVQQATYLADARGVEDEARDEIRITVPMAAFKKLRTTTMKPGATVTYLAAFSTRMWGGDGSGVTGDYHHGAAVGVAGRDEVHGNAAVTYTLGAPSCVAVGR